MTRFLPSAALLGLALVACGGTPEAALAGDQPRFEPVAAGAEGERLPAAELPRLDGDGVLDTAELVGDPVVVNVWATWCAFCVAEMPELESLHRELGDAVRFVGINRRDDRDRALVLAAATGVTYELVEDRDGHYFHALGGRGMPTTVLVDADGVIRHRHTGPLTAAELRALVEKHLGR